ncbi:MAG: PadR family transcriptional regulator [Gemmatimonadetes bacterium]|nr:PadR family transcriptional regulator [Gemmatimonadota bacterium]
MVRDDETLPLLKGTLDLLVLKALSWGPQHGYGIATWLEHESDGALGVDDSALYQALHRLEGRRLVEAGWGMTENNRRARYYGLTRAGEQHLERATETWRRYAASVGAILALSGPRLNTGH